MGTPNREPQEYSKNIIEYKDLSSIPTIFLGFPVWGPHFNPFNHRLGGPPKKFLGVEVLALSLDISSKILNPNFQALIMP